MKTSIKTGLSLIIMVASMSVFAQKTDKKVHTFTVERIIKAPVEKVWKVVGEDFSAIANSHPKIVSSSHLQGTPDTGEGCERVCNFNEKGTKYVKEKQVDYDPANFTFKAQVYHAGRLPLDPEYNSAVYKVEPIDANSCKLVIEMTLRTKPAFMGAMAKGKFKKVIADYTIAIEHHVLTGENVNKENFKEIKRKYKK